MRQGIDRPGLTDEMDEADPVRRQVERARLGDREAAAWLFDRFQRRVLRFCLSFASISEADAQDLVQEVFVRAFGGIGRLKRLDRFESWLFAIARRRCLTLLGRLRRREQDQRRWAAERQAIDSGGQEDDHVRKVEIQVVAEEIERMTDSRIKQAGRLFYRQGLDTTAIAEQMGVPVSTVTTCLSRFRARIRRRLVARILEVRGHADWEAT